MELTNEILRGFIGGQAEIQNPKEGYIFRGAIAEITLEGSDIRIRWAWIAQGKGVKGGPHMAVPTGGWEKAEDQSDYGVSLLIYAVSDIGPSHSGESGRLCLNSWVTGETTVLFPPDGSKLDPSQVDGLELAKSTAS